MLTKKDACIAYAKMLNTLDSSCIETILSDDFRLISQLVLTDIENKNAYLKYIKAKLQTIKSSNADVYAEMAKWNDEDCILLAQNTKENLVGMVLMTTVNDKLTQASMCIIPTVDSVVRSGIYPN